MEFEEICPVSRSPGAMLVQTRNLVWSRSGIWFGPNREPAGSLLQPGAVPSVPPMLNYKPRQLDALLAIRHVVQWQQRGPSVCRAGALGPQSHSRQPIRNGRVCTMRPGEERRIHSRRRASSARLAVSKGYSPAGSPSVRRRARSCWIVWEHTATPAHRTKHRSARTVKKPPQHCSRDLFYHRSDRANPATASQVPAWNTSPRPLREWTIAPDPRLVRSTPAASGGTSQLPGYILGIFRPKNAFARRDRRPLLCVEARPNARIS